MDSPVFDEFAHPSSAYRGMPFWAWNGKLEREELRRQIRVLQRMGMGGFFMHARVGLDTPYLTHGLPAYKHASRKPRRWGCKPGYMMRTVGPAAPPAGK